MKTFMIAVKCAIDKPTAKKNKNLMPVGFSGFLYEINADNVDMAISLALSATRQWSNFYELDISSTAADITP